MYWGYRCLSTLSIIQSHLVVRNVRTWSSRSADLRVVTEGTVLGPFHTEDAHSKANGQDIDSDEDGVPLLVYGVLKDTSGVPIAGAKIDVWETDSKGFYDTQYLKRDGPHSRAVLHSDENGVYWFKGIVPVSYPVPVDGPVATC